MCRSWRGQQCALTRTHSVPSAMPCKCTASHFRCAVRAKLLPSPLLHSGHPLQACRLQASNLACRGSGKQHGRAGSGLEARSGAYPGPIVGPGSMTSVSCLSRRKEIHLKFRMRTICATWADEAASDLGHKLGLKHAGLAARPDLELRLADAQVGSAAQAFLRDQLQLAARVRVHQPPAAVPHNIVLQAQRALLTLGR